MLDTQVYLITSDVHTRCHCGHEIKEEGEYYVIRTSAPRWVSLCMSCVHLLNQPIKVDMDELKRRWVWKDKASSREVAPIKVKVIKKDIGKRDSESIKIAEWV